LKGDSGRGLCLWAGPPLPKSGRPMFAVTAWTSIGLNELCEVVPAEHLRDRVESLV
jgi:hypothetical protein